MRGKAIVIGAGLGGLATAARLQQNGWQVTVLEKNSRVGGRCNLIAGGGFQFDTGPTLLLMRDALDAFFASLGRRTDDYLDLVRMHPNYRVHFGDGSSLEFSSDLEHMAAEVEALEPGGGTALRRYLADAGYKYHVSRQRFVERNFCHWYEFFTPVNLYYVWRTNTLRKLDRHAARHFQDPRLVAAFTFQTMYLGLAPHQAPAVYSLLPYTELTEGIWYPRGGMYRIADSLLQVACELGVEVRVCQTVTAVLANGRHVTGVELASGDVEEADVVVANADLPYTYQNLLPETARGRFGPRRLAALDYGSSAYLLYLGVDRQYPDLHQHNVFLARDIAQNFDAIFGNRRLPEDPSLYVNVPNRTDPGMAPPGNDGIYVLVPVPHLTDSIDWVRDEPHFRRRVLRKLEACGLTDLTEHIVFERSYTPLDFARDYNLALGSAFGLSHTFRQVGYMRPANKARELDNLYFVGASTAPGGGIPMVLIGSGLTVERVERDFSHA